jgi:hypothetical protein
MFPRLIGGRRTVWGQGKLPLHIVQLAPILGRDSYPIILDAQVTIIKEVGNIPVQSVIRKRLLSLAAESKAAISLSASNTLKSGLVTHGPDPPGPFMIPRADGDYYPATATDHGVDSLAVLSPSAWGPKSVRYGWTPYPTTTGLTVPAHVSLSRSGMPLANLQLKSQSGTASRNPMSRSVERDRSILAILGQPITDHWIKIPTMLTLHLPDRSNPTN